MPKPMHDLRHHALTSLSGSGFDGLEAQARKRTDLVFFRPDLRKYLPGATTGFRMNPSHARPSIMCNAAGTLRSSAWGLSQ